MKDITELLNEYKMTKKQLAEKFNIPLRTVENWCSLGSNQRKCADYVLGMLEECLKKDFSNEMCFVFYAQPSDSNPIYFGTLAECNAFSDGIRHAIPADARAEMDVYIKSIGEIVKGKMVSDVFSSLTDEDKNDIIEVDGRMYIKKIYNMNH